MSFATLSSTLAECSAISRLEITKNPFDSDMELDKLNLPAMSSPSIFVKQETPASQKRGFRWSIEQISKLDPADIEEFPNQEYSSTYERPEDETKAQEAINEYFSRGTILPSPWTPDSHVKHVTFSPLPPSTAYISGDDDSMADVSHNSSGTSAKKQFCDGSCQTMLTFPPLFDLTKLVDSGYYSYIEDEDTNLTNRELNVSSLRRKLFSQDDSNSPVKTDEVASPMERITKSILKSPKNLVTSSPRKAKPGQPLPDFSSPAFLRDSKTSPSPQVSPIKSAITPEPCLKHIPNTDVLEFDATLSNEDLLVSDVLESSDVCVNPSLLPDMSPITDRKAVHSDNSDEVLCGEKSPSELNDGGPMKLSDLSNLAMDYEHGDIEIATLQPLTSTQHKVPHTASHRNLEEHFESQTDGLSRRKSNIFTTQSQATIAGTHNTDVIPDNWREAASSDSGSSDAKADDVITTDFDDIKDDDSRMLSFTKDIYKSQTGVDNDGRIDNLDSVTSNSISGKDKPMKDQVSKIGTTKCLTGRQGDVRDNGWYKRLERDGRDIAECDGNKENVGFNKDFGARANDSELVERASAAIRRADRLVKDTCTEQSKLSKRMGTSNNYLNWSRVNGASMWHPIDVSTPVVNGNLHPMTSLPMTSTAAVPQKRVFRQNSDPDSLSNLLTSFANSKLDGASRILGGRSDSGVDTTCSDDYWRVRSRRALGLDTRRRRNSGDIGLFATSNSPRNGRHGYAVKRSSWPIWKTSRYRYATARSISPTFQSRPLRPRNKLSARHCEELARFEPTAHYQHYYDGMHSTSSRSYIQ